MKKLKFGGPKLKEGQRTWYVNPKTKGGGQIFVGPGEEVPFDEVADAQGYVDRGQASVPEGAAGAKPKE